MDQRLQVVTNNGENQSAPATARGIDLMYVVEIRAILASRACFAGHNDVGIRCCSTPSNMDGPYCGHRQQSLLLIHVEIKYVLTSSDKIRSDRFKPASHTESTVELRSINITYTRILSGFKTTQPINCLRVCCKAITLLRTRSYSRHCYIHRRLVPPAVARKYKYY